MKQLLASLLFSLLAFSAISEINMAPSLEWLCTDADIVSTGRMIGIETREDSTGFYSVLTIDIISNFKGFATSTIMVITTTQNNSWNNAESAGDEILVFLKQDTLNKGRYTLLTLYGSNEWSVIPLETGKAFTGDFRVLKERIEITNYCTESLLRIAGRKGKLHIIEIPWDTEAMRELYSGSTCYLYVPDFLYPESIKGYYE